MLVVVGVSSFGLLFVGNCCCLKFLPLMVEFFRSRHSSKNVDYLAVSSHFLPPLKDFNNQIAPFDGVYKLDSGLGYVFCQLIDQLCRFR